MQVIAQKDFRREDLLYIFMFEKEGAPPPLIFMGDCWQICARAIGRDDGDDDGYFVGFKNIAGVAVAELPAEFTQVLAEKVDAWKKRLRSNDREEFSFITRAHYTRFHDSKTEYTWGLLYLLSDASLEKSPEFPPFISDFSVFLEDISQQFHSRAMYRRRGGKLYGHCLFTPEQVVSFYQHYAAVLACYWSIGRCALSSDTFYLHFVQQDSFRNQLELIGMFNYNNERDLRQHVDDYGYNREELGLKGLYQENFAGGSGNAIDMKAVEDGRLPFVSSDDLFGLFEKRRTGSLSLTDDRKGILSLPPPEIKTPLQPVGGDISISDFKRELMNDFTARFPLDAELATASKLDPNGDNAWNFCDDVELQLQPKCAACGFHLALREIFICLFADKLSHFGSLTRNELMANLRLVRESRCPVCGNSQLVLSQRA